MKLVRDNIPDMYQQHSYRRATPDERKLFLRLKLAEEVGEVLSAPTTDKLMSELGDLRDVIDALESEEGILVDDLKRREDKSASLGGFSEGWILE